MRVTGRLIDNLKCVIQAQAHVLARQQLRRATTMAAEGSPFPYRLIDSHLHVWSDGTAESRYKYAAGYEAPPGLRDAG